MADKATIIYVVRHGESESNRNGVVGGHTDAPLTDTGCAQARETKLALRDIHFDTAYSSNLQRAIETGEIIFDAPIPKDHQWPRLRERDYGSLTGKPAQHLQTIDAIMVNLSESGARTYKHVPDMESDDEVSARFINELEKVARANTGKTILVAAHGATIRTMLMRLKNVGYSAFPSGSFKNAGYVKLVYRRGHFTVEQIVR